MSAGYRGAMAFVLLAQVAGPAAAGDFEDALQSHWEGRVVVLRTGVTSDCLPCYSLNEITEAGVTGRGSRRFAPGELGWVRALRTTRGTLELDIELVEPVLVSVPRGGLILYEGRVCRAGMRISLPSGVVKQRDVDAVELRLASVVQAFATESEARASTSWNGRVRAPLPEGYEATLHQVEARKALWRADAERQAQRVARDALPAWENEDYLTGFAHGLEHVREEDWGDCADLVEVPLPEMPGECPGMGSSPSAERTCGWVDGLAFGKALRLLGSLERCRPTAEQGGE